MKLIFNIMVVVAYEAQKEMVYIIQGISSLNSLSLMVFLGHIYLGIVNIEVSVQSLNAKYRCQITAYLTVDFTFQKFALFYNYVANISGSRLKKKKGPSIPDHLQMGISLIGLKSFSPPQVTLCH